MSYPFKTARPLSRVKKVSEPYLIYTIAFDQPRTKVMRSMSKLLVSSLLRTGFSGHIRIFSNGHTPLFFQSRQNVTQTYVSTAGMSATSLAEFACAFKYAAAEYIDEPESFDKILYLDCDFLALRSVNHLFAFDEELRFVEEPNQPISSDLYAGYITAEEAVAAHRMGSNAGLWCCAGKTYRAMTAEMKRISKLAPVVPKFWGDQPAWNRLLLDGKFNAAAYPYEEIQFPLAYSLSYQDYIKAALVHICGVDVHTKGRFQFGLFMDRFFGDGAPVLIDLLET